MIPFHFLAKLYPFVTERHWNDVACLSWDNRPAIIPIFCHLILRFTATWSVRGMRYILLVVASQKNEHRIPIITFHAESKFKKIGIPMIRNIELFLTYKQWELSPFQIWQNLCAKKLVLSSFILTSCLQVVSVALLLVNAVKLKIQIGIKEKLAFLIEN